MASIPLWYNGVRNHCPEYIATPECWTAGILINTRNQNSAELWTISPEMMSNAIWQATKNHFVRRWWSIELLGWLAKLVARILSYRCQLLFLDKQNIASYFGRGVDSDSLRQSSAGLFSPYRDRERAQMCNIPKQLSPYTHSLCNLNVIIWWRCNPWPGSYDDNSVKSTRYLFQRWVCIEEYVLSISHRWFSLAASSQINSEIQFQRSTWIAQIGDRAFFGQV